VVLHVYAVTKHEGIAEEQDLFYAPVFEISLVAFFVSVAQRVGFDMHDKVIAEKGIVLRKVLLKYMPVLWRILTPAHGLLLRLKQPEKSFGTQEEDDR